MQKLMSAQDAEKALTDHGVDIDWSRIDWTKVVLIVQAILAILAKRNPPVGASGEAGCASPEMVKAHFDAIAALAACGSDCCTA